MLSAGIDVGSVAAKAVVFDVATRSVAGSALLPTGWNTREAGEAVLDAACREAGAGRHDLGQVVATGYGRIALPFADKAVTEISCHARGAPLALWRTEADKADIAFAKKYLGLNDEEGFNAGIIRGGMSCQSRLFVAQMQDYLGLGKGCRMNTPGTSSGNWQWRMLSGEASKKLAKSIHETTRIYGRL